MAWRGGSGIKLKRHGVCEDKKVVVNGTGPELPFLARGGKWDCPELPFLAHNSVRARDGGVSGVWGGTGSIAHL